MRLSKRPLQGSPQAEPVGNMRCHVAPAIERPFPDLEHQI